MLRITEVVKNLIFINVIVFFARMTLPQFVPELSMFPPFSANFKPYQLVSHFFMHADMNHLIFNMLTLFFLGPMLESKLGSKRFFLLYLISALGSFLLTFGIDYYQYSNLIQQLEPGELDIVKEKGRSLILSGKNYSNLALGEMNYLLNIPSVGASGAIYGVLAGLAALLPNMKVQLLFPPIPIKIGVLALILVGFDLYRGVTMANDGIGHFAHLGGAIAGFLVIKYWYNKK